MFIQISFDYARRYKIKKNELLSYMSIFFFTFHYMSVRTSCYLLEKYSDFLIYIAVFLSLIEIIIKRILTKKQLILFGIIGMILFIDSIPSGFHMLIYWFIILYGLRDKNIDKYLKFVFILLITFTIIIFFLYKINVCENIQSIQYLNGKVRIRNSLGFSSWTVLPFQFLSLVMYYVYFNKDKVHFYLYVAFILIGFYLYLHTNTRSAFAYLIIFTILSYLCRFIKNIRWKKLNFLVLLPCFFTFISYFLLYFYQKGSFYLQKLNSILNNRFFYAAQAVDMYKLNWLSNKEVKWTSEAQNYLIVDNSYLSILIKWGIVGLVMVLFVYSYLIFWAIKKNDKYLLLCILEILVICLMWERLLNFLDVIFVLLFGHFFAQKRLFKVNSKKIGKTY